MLLDDAATGRISNPSGDKAMMNSKLFRYFGIVAIFAVSALVHAQTYTELHNFDCVKDVTVDGRRVQHLQQGGHLKFQATVPANESAELRIVYSDGPKLPLSEDGVKYRAKAVLRRYLSEFRDNYLSQNELLQHGAVRIKEALRL